MRTVGKTEAVWFSNKTVSGKAFHDFPMPKRTGVKKVNMVRLHITRIFTGRNQGHRMGV